MSVYYNQYYIQGSCSLIIEDIFDIEEKLGIVHHGNCIISSDICKNTSDGIRC